MASPDDERTAFDKLLYRLVMTNDDRIEAMMIEQLPILLDRLSTTTEEGVRNKVSIIKKRSSLARYC